MITPTTTATLTHIRLNLRSPTVRNDLTDAVSMHKTLMRLAPDHLGPQPRRQAGLLYRLDYHPIPTLLIQATMPPDLTQLPDTYGTAQTRDLTPMFTALTPGQPVRYRIAANASARLHLPHNNRVGPRERGKVVPLSGQRALSWWHRRATQAGLTIHTIETALCPDRRRKPDQPGPYHLLTRFDGTATVTDPQSLTHALLTGIGKGKAYGAGLLTLAPA